MYAVYLKKNLKLITFLSILNDPNNAEYEKPIYSYIPVSMEVFLNFKDKLSFGKEIIVKDDLLQEMTYAEKLVKFLKDQENFKKNTYAKIKKYDFRLEGINYIKTAEDDPNYLLYLKEEKFKKTKQEKIDLAKEIFNKIEIEIIDITTNNVVDTYSPSKEIVAVFEQGIDFEETPFEFFKISNKNESILLPNSSLQTLMIETRDILQYQATNFLRNEREIEKLTTLENIENYQIKAGKKLGEEVIDKVKVIVKITENQLFISQVKKIKITEGSVETTIKEKTY